MTLIGRRRRRQTALLSQVLTRGRFIVVLGALSHLIGGEALRRTIVHPAQAREIRHSRTARTPQARIRLMRVARMRVSRMHLRRRRCVARGALARSARIADRKCRNDAAREPGASRTRALAVSLAYRREDLEGDPARFATAFVDGHFRFSDAADARAARRSRRSARIRNRPLPG